MKRLKECDCKWVWGYMDFEVVVGVLGRSKEPVFSYDRHVKNFIYREVSTKICFSGELYI